MQLDSSLRTEDATIIKAKEVASTPSQSGAEPRVTTIAIQPRSEEAWSPFVYQLHASISALEENEYLIVSIKRSNYFVQFAAQGAFGMRMEAVSTFYLPEGQSLDDAKHALLLEMGWHAPTNVPDDLELDHPPDGSPNYFLDVAAPVPFEALTLLAVNTLISIYGASHPLQLEYTAFGEGETSIRFPTLGIRQRAARS
ncbi:MAG: hypothetical protein ROZ64_10510 [Burkholderiaceae bacterium]|jgi:hypothetical protein|nr:hypothetical protein [Burkholderiaceae bacterium]